MNEQQIDEKVQGGLWFIRALFVMSIGFTAIALIIMMLVIPKLHPSKHSLVVILTLLAWLWPFAYGYLWMDRRTPPLLGLVIFIWVLMALISITVARIWGMRIGHQPVAKTLIVFAAMWTWLTIPLFIGRAVGKWRRNRSHLVS